ncbi:MAG: hypothetical protein M1825_001996 [Sarcosagium campestre]|nr:MAG: hypothetical protein M1825_001996 [Sarcosagium campestre]
MSSAPASSIASASGSTSAGATGTAANPVKPANGNSIQAGTVNFPAPKTDKPRPHICATCARSFARLEHLKRHERSHTKEKPFECPECTRRFARRDLLLRHQQKLHMTTTPSSRPRSGRRESTSSTTGSGPGRVRKNSVINAPMNIAGGIHNSSMRPRANTISHIDGSTLGMIAAANATSIRNGNILPRHAHHPSLNQLPGPGGYDFRGMSTASGHHGGPQGLPKLDTQSISRMESNGTLHTAPPYGGFPPEFDVDGIFFGGPGQTINPAQLHWNGSPQSLSMGAPASPFTQGFPGLHPGQSFLEDEEAFDWMNGFDNQLSFSGANDVAVDESSPSALSTASQSAMSEVILDGFNHPTQASGLMWPQNQVGTSQPPSSFPADLTTAAFVDIIPPPGTISPQRLQAQNGVGDAFFADQPHVNAMSPPTMSGMPGVVGQNPLPLNIGTPSNSSASTSGSARQSSVTSVSTDSITEATRQALLSSLSQPNPYHSHRQYPTTDDDSPSQNTVSSACLPSTRDIQRYVGAYIQYFHPHLPFLHIPTLSFTTPTSSSDDGSGSHSNNDLSNHVPGGECLILSMAAIGALYEFEHNTSKELFESAKRMIQLYLEERRRSDLSANSHASDPMGQDNVQNTPLWLVQAMLLNVIYGHNCGDKTAADIASTHCGALVYLARAAELTQPLNEESWQTQQGSSATETPSREDILMKDDAPANNLWDAMVDPEISEHQTEWHQWKQQEERKRTLYAVFILSSLLVSAYNHAPALTNSEIRLDLPCDEQLWAAESAQVWHAHGGAVAAEQNALAFSSSLGNLLSASQRQLQDQDTIRPSTFGCLILINALHNYIWETRQHHRGAQWTAQETEAMHAHIEPALKAWQAAWSSNPHHGLERPSPFGPLAADCVPLLDLAYLRLFVNLGRSKEAFWQRDFEGMADELANGTDFFQHADQSPSSASSTSDPTDSLNSANSITGSPDTATSSPDLNAMKTPTPEHPLPAVASAQLESPSSGQSSKRERHLRKAAFYAADSLSMSDKLGITFADFNSRELPLQSALCAFDCAQVLAEWVSTVQERVGQYLGIIGRDDIDLEAVPGIMLLEKEDCILFEKIGEFLRSTEQKALYSISDVSGGVASPEVAGSGYGSRILRYTAHTLDRAAVWPVTHLMARSLETQAVHVNNRAEKSLMKM